MQLKRLELDLNINIRLAHGGVVVTIPTIVTPPNTSLGLDGRPPLNVYNFNTIFSNKEDVLAAIKKTLDTFYD